MNDYIESLNDYTMDDLILQTDNIIACYWFAKKWNDSILINKITSICNKIYEYFYKIDETTKSLDSLRWYSKKTIEIIKQKINSKEECENIVPKIGSNVNIRISWNDNDVIYDYNICKFEIIIFTMKI